MNQAQLSRCLFSFSLTHVIYILIKREHSTIESTLSWLIVSLITTHYHSMIFKYLDVSHTYYDALALPTYTLKLLEDVCLTAKVHHLYIIQFDVVVERD